MSGDSASSSAATPLAANASTSAFLTTPRSCSGDAAKSEAEPTSTEKGRFSSGSRSSAERTGTRSAKSGSRRTASLEHKSHMIRVNVDFRDQPSRRHPCERLRSLTRLLVGPPVRKAARLRRQMSAYDLFDLRDAKLEIRCRGRNCQKMLRQKQILFFDEQLFERVHRSDNN